METVIHLVLMEMAIGADNRKKHSMTRLDLAVECFFYVKSEIINRSALTAPPALTAVGYAS